MHARTMTESTSRSDGHGAKYRSSVDLHRDGDAVVPRERRDEVLAVLARCTATVYRHSRPDGFTMLGHKGQQLFLNMAGTADAYESDTP